MIFRSHKLIIIIEKKVQEGDLSQDNTRDNRRADTTLERQTDAPNVKWVKKTKAAEFLSLVMPF